MASTTITEAPEPNINGRNHKGAVFGHVRGVPVGRTWEDREGVRADRIHGHNVAGIHGRKAVGAFSVVLSKGFEDEDHGDNFVYIGSGGRDPGVTFGTQTCDQSFDNRFNAALLMSVRRQTPVRVIRGCELNSEYAPSAGFRYDGLYLVSNPRIETTKAGFKVCKYDFTRCSDQLPLPLGDGDQVGQRTDIEIRRKMWMELRRSLYNTEPNPAPNPSQSRSSPSLVGENSEPSSPVSDNDDSGVEPAGGKGKKEDDVNDNLIGDADDVEDAMEPVLDLLDALKRSTDDQKTQRGNAVLKIGRRVNTILADKKKKGIDKWGRDAEWWYKALWSYVACAMPTTTSVPPEAMEKMYEAREIKANKGKASGQ